MIVLHKCGEYIVKAFKFILALLAIPLLIPFVLMATIAQLIYDFTPIWNKHKDKKYREKAKHWN